MSALAQVLTVCCSQVTPNTADSMVIAFICLSCAANRDRYVVVPCTYAPNIIYEIDGSSEYTSSDVSECYPICDEDPDCLAFLFIADTGVCRWKDSLSTLDSSDCTDIVYIRNGRHMHSYTNVVSVTW